MKTSEDLIRNQGTCVTFTISLFGLLLFAVMSSVSAARPHRVQHPFFVDTPTTVNATEGSDVVLPCVVHGKGTKTVVWKKVYQANPITIGDYVFDPDPSYKVHQRPLDTNWYQQSHGAGTSQYGSQTNHYGSHGRTHDSRGHGGHDGNRNHDDSYGSSGHQSGTSGNAYPNLQHSSNSHRDGGYPENPNWNLEILGVAMKHAGIFECQVTTSSASYIRNVTLDVSEDKNPKQKKTGITLSGTTYVEKGNIIDLNCTATAIEYRPKGVDWFKDGSKIKNGKNAQIMEYVLSKTNVLHSQLQIMRATMEDAGTYVCRFSPEHVESIKVIVLNTDSPKNARETMSGGLRKSDGVENAVRILITETASDGLSKSDGQSTNDHNLAPSWRSNKIFTFVWTVLLVTCT